MSNKRKNPHKHDAQVKYRQEQQKKKKLDGIIFAVALVIVAVLVAGLYFLLRDSEAPAAPDPSQDITRGGANLHHAQIEIADYGTITLELDADVAPITVENFMNLAKSGFYDGLTFHRIMNGFMMQGGDPEGTGFGGSDKTIKGEFSENGVDNPISHVRGVISMARSEDMDSASSQFFIVQSDSTFLDGKYAAFGSVTEGMDIVDKICADAKPTDNNGSIPADQQPVITTIRILD